MWRVKPAAMPNPAICGPISFTAAWWQAGKKILKKKEVSLSQRYTWNRWPVSLGLYPHRMNQKSINFKGMQIYKKKKKSLKWGGTRSYSSVWLPNEWLPLFNQSHFIPHNHNDMPSIRGQSAWSVFCFSSLSGLVLMLYQRGLLML